MIVARLAGGLGNQLFQFAAALALRGETVMKVLLHTQSLARYRAVRQFDLARLIDLPPWCTTDTGGAGEHRLLSFLVDRRVGRFFPLIAANDRNFERRLTATVGGSRFRLLMLDGYFQHDWKSSAFEQARQAIAAMVKPEFGTDATPSDPTQGLLHIRGGDFLASEEHRVVDAEYYGRALDALRERAGQIRSIRVVTDDPAHAHRLIEPLRLRHADLHFDLPTQPSPDWQTDFTAIRNATARVLGNSSFSWWAAALDRRQSLTVTPDEWLRGIKRDVFLAWETALVSRGASSHSRS